GFVTEGGSGTGAVHAPRHRRDPADRVLTPALVGELSLAALLGAATELVGVALIATAAWLLCRAAQRPPMAALGVAIVAVRAFAITKATLRYGERLTGHDAALRLLASLRARIFAGLVGSHGGASGGAHAGRRGDAATRRGDAATRRGGAAARR